MPSSSNPYRLFEHTADLGMEIKGKDLPDLFFKAAWSFFDLMLKTRKVDRNQERTIVVEAPDLEALLVAWLGELLFLFETGPLVFSHFIIQSLTPTSLRALGQGEFFDPSKHRIKLMIKAVTYHQLRIWKKKGIWKARIIFDL